MENCGKCNLGPDHPQEEIYEESKHGVAVRDLKDHMNLDAKDWVLGKEYSQAPDYAHWHGVYEVAERFYQELIPEAREIAAHADESGRKDEPEAVRKVIDEFRHV